MKVLTKVVVGSRLHGLENEDSERANSVGEKVIKTMYNSFIKPNKHVAQYTDIKTESEKLCQEMLETVISTLPELSKQSGRLKEKILPVVSSAVQRLENSLYTTQSTKEQRSKTSSSHVTDVKTYPKTSISHNPDLPTCIIVDIDGTLAHMTDRSPYDYTKVSTDVVDPIVAGIVRKYAQRDPNTDFPDNYIIIVSGRMGPICEAETRQWLQDNHIPYDELYMRQVDQIPDTDVKKEIYDKYIKPRYNVRFVLDDRDRVVKMWRELGLKVLQVGEGDF